jgi:hypothetical protein
MPGLSLAISLLAWWAHRPGRVGVRRCCDLSATSARKARDRIVANRHVNGGEQLATEAVRCALLPQLDNAIHQRHELGVMARLPAA